MAVTRAEAIVCGVRGHGEHGAIVRLLTADVGLIAGYVRGGRSRTMRPVLIPGNQVVAELRARSDGQLAGATVDLVISRAPLLEEPLPAAGIEWVTALTTATLPEAMPLPRLYLLLGALLAAISAAPAARGWAGAVARYELALLAELGFGLQLEECVVTGTRDNLVYISPKSGGAVSRAAALGHEARLFPLPGFLAHGGSAQLDDALAALRITGHFLDRDLFGDRRDARFQSLRDARRRLIERLERAVA
jgi:DNA repair protein RecO (recombination protein O)